MKKVIGLVFTMMLFFSCEIEDVGGSGSVNGCPTTAACGCSGHNKSECENDICCKWTVGEGCDCR